MWRGSGKVWNLVELVNAAVRWGNIRRRKQRTSLASPSYCGETEVLVKWGEKNRLRCRKLSFFSLPILIDEGLVTFRLCQLGNSRPGPFCLLPYVLIVLAALYLCGRSSKCPESLVVPSRYSLFLIESPAAQEPFAIRQNAVVTLRSLGAGLEHRKNGFGTTKELPGHSGTRGLRLRCLTVLAQVMHLSLAL